MRYLKKPLLAAVFIVSVGCAQSMPDTEEGVFFGASIEKNKETLLDTNQCIQCGLQGVNLSGVTLRQAILLGSNLTDANLKGTDLTNANLRGTNLSGADLTDATLRGANLFGAILSGTTVQGANFREAQGLTPEQKEYLRKNGASVY